MKRILQNTDIMGVRADALIYSTNVQLMLSGGVGACLLEKFGDDFQSNLYRQLNPTGRKLAEVGEIFLTDTGGDPWKLVIHTIATDPMYHTDPDIVSSLVTRSFDICSKRGDINSLVMSPLGAGYGDLDLDIFLRIVDDVATQFDGSGIKSITVCCDFELSFRELVSTANTLDTAWGNLV